MMNKVNYNKNTQEDIQMALTYAMYMMLSSYFNHAVCMTPLYEQKLYLRYMSQKVKDQYQLEDYCLQYLRKGLLAKYPKKFWNREVEVRLNPNPDGKSDTIVITDPHLELKMTVEYQPRLKGSSQPDAKPEAKEKADAKASGKKGRRGQKQEKKDQIRITYVVHRGNAPKRKSKDKAKAA